MKEVTPEYYWKYLHIKNDGFRSLKDVVRASKNDNVCYCGNPVWRLGRCGLCFTCTTGESDGKDDYELISNS
jgi:hypothetical protein